MLNYYVVGVDIAGREHIKDVLRTPEGAIRAAGVRLRQFPRVVVRQSGKVCWDSKDASRGDEG